MSPLRDWWCGAPGHLWDIQLHVRRAYALTHLDKPDQAALHYLHALWLNPHAWMWPLDRAARQRGQRYAQAEEWPRAVEAFTLAVHQPDGSLDDGYALLLAQLSVGQTAAYQHSCQALLDHFDNIDDARLARMVLFRCTLAPCAKEDAPRLVQLAEHELKQQSNAASLHYLGAALYRAGRDEDAVKTLDESVKVQGKGGYIDTWMFLSMAHRRLEHFDTARKCFEKFDAWLKKARLAINPARKKRKENHGCHG